MVVVAYWFSAGFISAFNKKIDWTNDAMKVALATSSYTPNQDTHDFFNDVTNEVTGTGYTAGGATLGSKTLTNTNNVVTLDAADATWTTSTITARRAVLYDSTPGTAATNPLLLWIDFGQDEISNAGTFTVQFNAAGIATCTLTDAAGFP